MRFLACFCLGDYRGLTGGSYGNPAIGVIGCGSSVKRTPPLSETSIQDVEPRDKRDPSAREHLQKHLSRGTLQGGRATKNRKMKPG
jgi:hypothetical protein